MKIRLSVVEGARRGSDPMGSDPEWSDPEWSDPKWSDPILRSDSVVTHV